jgi:hypothetical protein
MRISVTELRTPELEFGDNKAYFTDPREGLASAGPFSLRFGRAHKSQIRLGLVGSRDLLEDARLWYKRCETRSSHGQAQKSDVPRLPGIRASVSISCSAG